MSTRALQPRRSIVGRTAVHPHIHLMERYERDPRIKRCAIPGCPYTEMDDVPMKREKSREHDGAGVVAVSLFDDDDDSGQEVSA